MASLHPSLVPLVIQDNDDSAIKTVIRLADEGIPVRAIARACKIPGDEVYEILHAAMRRGDITEIPKDDWPPGSARAKRSLPQHNVLEDDEALKFLCSIVFKTTRLQSSILAVLLKRSEVTKEQLHQVIEQLRDPNRDETDLKMVDVIICHLRRKLAPKIENPPFKIQIKTIWGIGYRMEIAERDRAVTALEAHMANPEISDTPPVVLAEAA
jgi:hypothetical protein